MDLEGQRRADWTGYRPVDDATEDGALGRMVNRFGTVAVVAHEMP